MFKWFWSSDSGLVEYQDSVNVLIESAFQKGEKEIAIDSERYIDFPNFLQRRYDDKTKRRTVERIAGSLFSNVTFCLLGPFDDVSRRESLALHIGSCDGALLSKKPHKKVDYVVVGEGWEKNLFITGQVRDSLRRGIRVIHERALSESLKAHQFPMVGMEEITEIPSSTVTTTTDVGSVKRPLNEESSADVEVHHEIAPPPPPPPSLPIPSAAPLVSSSSSSLKHMETHVAPPPSKKSKADGDSVSSEPTRELQEGATNWAVGTEWIGAVSQDSSYPLVLNVTSMDSDTFDFSGVIQWPTLGGAMTRIRGTASGGTVSFVEEATLCGDDWVETGSKYSLSFVVADTCEGSFVSSSGSAGTIFLRLSKAEQKPSFHTGASFSGIMMQPVHVDISISSVQGTVVQGVVKKEGLSSPEPFTGSISNGNELVTSNGMVFLLGTDDIGTGVLNEHRFFVVKQ